MKSTLLILYTLVCHIAGESPSSCEFATPNKYVGYYYLDSGSTKVEPYFYSILSNTECKKKCRKEDSCYATSHNDVNQCFFYNTTELHYFHGDTPSSISIWKECPWKALSIQPVDGRCKGLFVQYFDNAINALHSYLTLDVFHNITRASCLYKCSLHPLCETINIRESFNSCSFHQSWPHRHYKQEIVKGTDLFKWTCIPGFEKSLQLPQKRNVLKCSGYWKIKSRNSTLPNIYNPGVYFFTQSYLNCLLECTENPTCYFALFNITDSICILPFTEFSDSNKYLESLNFIEFEWMCVKKDSRNPHMSEREQSYVKMGLVCVQLINNSNVYIAKDNCGHFPNKKYFQSCDHEIETRKWMANDSCLVNQSFWKFKTNCRNMNINGTIASYVTRIFTGLTSFWMMHSESHIFKNISFLECRRFDGSNSFKAIVSSDIITRKQWYAYKPQGEIPIFNVTPTYVVLSASQQPFYGCRTRFSCTSLLRNLQIVYFNGAGASKYSDIPYNFMLDESGNIYEGRGWTNACQAVGKFNFVSLCFGFIGRFRDIKPSVNFLTSIKKLIKYAVENKYLREDYILYIHQDATTHNISRNYAIIIKEWYRYRGFVPKDCRIVSILPLILSGAVFVIIIIFIIIMNKYIHSTKNCRKCDFLHLVVFKQIYPKKINIKVKELEHMVDLSINTRQCIVRHKENSNIQRKFIKFCNIWFLNRSMKTLSTKSLDYDLEDYLNTFQTYKKKVEVYEAIVNNCRARMEDKVHIVSCFTNTHSRMLFEALTANKLCVCHNFCINFVSFSDVSLNVI